MKRILSRLGFGKASPDATQPMMSPAPTVDLVDPGDGFVAIGDIHGSLPLLETLLAKIETDYPDLDIICVGDFVDRGDFSADVLRLLAARHRDAPERFHCLLGNHEEMLLGFLDDPIRTGSRWMRYGGLQTLASFGISPHRGPDKRYDETRDQLRDAMGEPLEAWLRERPLCLQRGNVAIVHAAADPALPLDQQSRKALLWGHPDFTKSYRSDGLWVLHGHTIVDHPFAEAGRIAVDTGAYATGRLTAAHVTRGDVRFITA